MIQSIECPRKITSQAPVLFIPNVLDGDFCRHLIHLWETEGNCDSGAMVEENGKLKEVFDHKQTIRREHTVRNEETLERLIKVIRDRVRPEIQKAFHFNITQVEGFTVVAYDASTGGYFRPHRDDCLEGTSYRRFAMSLNLSVGEYEGGYLRFSEYGSDLYQPSTGTALIFSCSLLHEATEVTKGRRFVLVSMFYGEQEAQQLEEYKRRMQQAREAIPG
jgi:predicted 2-oxoglutarate/Fe(II)-dependent dioxygenase YbiX